MEFPPLTVGVVTHRGSFVDFSSFLRELCPAFSCYPTRCQLIIVNNSGNDALADTRLAADNTDIGKLCDYTLVGSTENNIAVGRNAVFEHAAHNLVVFIDDDEFPIPAWLVHLVETHHRNQCGIVAGPAHPLYLFETPQWIQHVDLHNAKGKATDELIENCPTANVLIDKSRLVGELFNVQYGVSGGEDTEFFLRQHDAGVDMRWSDEASVYEYIPRSKSTARYMIKRCVQQGILNRRILTTRGDIPSQWYFVARSFAVFGLSLTIGALMTAGGHPRSGFWLKRAFGNLGHCLSLNAQLNPHA